jgi:OOP family OmpA-OmpF porin
MEFWTLFISDSSGEGCMKKRYQLLAVCVSFITSCSLGFAGNRPNTATFTLGDGYYRFSKKRHVDNIGIGFGEAGYNFTEHWGVEGLLGFFSTTSRQPENDNQNVRGTLFAFNAVYHFSAFHFLEPYILAGPGVLSMNPNGNEANTQGNVNAGIGTQIFLSPQIALRFEARDFYTITGGYTDVFLNGGVSILF